MAEENAFARILSRMQAADTGIEKTASAAPSAEPDAAARMLTTVQAVAKTASAKQEAPATSPRASLEKMAQEAAAAEEAQLLKQAQFMGAALADGFMERFAQYDAALSSTKTASAPDQATLEKVAQEAYLRGARDFEKRAAEEYQQGYQDQLAEIHKIASEIHYIGQQTAQQLINEARKSQ